MENFEKNLQYVQTEQLTSSEKIFGNMTTGDLKTAAEMFIYLITCSSDSPLLFKFYKDLLLKQPDQILLTLNRIMKLSNDTAFNKDLKLISQKIFMKVTEKILKDYDETKGRHFIGTYLISLPIFMVYMN